MRRTCLTMAALVAASILSTLALPAAATAQEPPAPAASARGGVELGTDEQKTLYALGLVLSQNLARLELQEGELAYVMAGLEDGVLDREPKVSLDEYAMKVQQLAQQRFAATAEREAAAGRQFMDEQAAREGATRTESGIVFFDLQEGSGASPAAGDVVRVHYTGTLPSGEKFDSSVDRGEPATFPLDRVIPCWTEAVQRMKVGGKARIVCPAELAYGAQGRPGIPPNSPLVFEVELLGIEAAPPAEQPQPEDAGREDGGAA